MANVKSLKGTQTEKLICASYLNETQSYARYLYYSQIADKEGLFPVGVIFRESADNELHHAKVFLKMLENTEVTASVETEAGFLGKTVDNIQTAMKEEMEGGFEYYMAAAKTAREEGFDDIASHFEAIASVEKFHYDRFARFLDMIQKGTLWKREKPVTWHCLVCGYEYVGTEPPVKCPACDHPTSHYICVEDGYCPAPAS
ncbi:MAG: rubrerythrin family protein [Muribaculaceae bacterium]|nr:rubrerythrin family protein [Muribaculaceae bacterium]